MTARNTVRESVDFAPVFEFIKDISGLTFPASRVTTVTEVFRSVMNERGFTTSRALIEQMRSEPACRDSIVAKLTIGETYFFRDPAQFQVLRELVLPELLLVRPPTSRIRVWSAGSASGEEAYSIAIVMEELAAADRAEIIATDISRPRLASAQRGQFGKWSMRGVPAETIDRYFSRDGDQFQIRERLRDRVRFDYLNLAEDTYPSLARGIYDMDVVMCRNVLIYFDEETVRRVAQNLLNSLSPDGWLLLGASDPPLSQMIECDVMTTTAGLVYRRPGSGTETALRARPAAPVIWPDIVDAVRHADWPALQPPSDDLSSLNEHVAVPPQPVDAVAQGVASADALTVTSLVRSLCNEGRTAEAIEMTMSIMADFASVPELHYLLGVALSHEGHNTAAIATVRRALYLDRTLVIAHVLLGQLLSRTGDRAMALRSFRNAAELLDGVDADNIVAATDGESALRIREIVNAQLRLITALS